MDVFEGAWKDDDSRWTADIIAQVPDYQKNLEDGLTYLDAYDFIHSADSIEVGEYRYDFVNNYLEILDDDGSQKVFTLELD